MRSRRPSVVAYLVFAMMLLILVALFPGPVLAATSAARDAPDLVLSQNTYFAENIEIILLTDCVLNAAPEVADVGRHASTFNVKGAWAARQGTLAPVLLAAT